MAPLRLKAVFGALILVFAVIVSQFLVPAVRGVFQGSELFLLPMIIFCLLGATLLILALKKKTLSGLRKKFLVLTGASAAGFFVFVFLHNAFYALAEIANQITVLKYVLEALHTIFFLIAIPVCPVGFLVGMIASVIFFIKARK